MLIYALVTISIAPLVAGRRKGTFFLVQRLSQLLTWDVLSYCSTIRVSGSDAVRYDFDGIYKLEYPSYYPTGLWRKQDRSGSRRSYGNTRFILPSKDRSRWEITRSTRFGSGENFVDAIAYPILSGTRVPYYYSIPTLAGDYFPSQICPAGLKWRVYQFRNYFARTRNVKVEVV